MALSKAQFEAAVDAYGPSLKGYFIKRASTIPEVVEDLLMEVFEKAWLKRDQFTDQGEGVGPWLFGIAGYVNLMYRRGVSRRLSNLERYKLDPTQISEAEPALERKRLPSAELKRALTRLERVDRQIIELSYGLSGSKSYEDLNMPAAKIAALLTKETAELWKPGRVSVRKHRAIDRLRKEIGTQAYAP